MKKIMLLLLVLITASAGLQAQSFSEWFRQKKTQKRYLLQQIAALQVYVGYAQEGYHIARQGLTTIGGLTGGEFDLHNVFFTSLKTVNPEIRQYAKVADVIALQLKIVQDCNRTNRQLSAGDAFNDEELAYIRRVLGRLLDDCENTLDELIIVTTDGRLEMKDNERLRRIDKLYRDMQDQYTFSQSFGNEAKIMAAVRLQEKTEVQTGRALYGLKNEQP